MVAVRVRHYHSHYWSDPLHSLQTSQSKCKPRSQMTASTIKRYIRIHAETGTYEFYRAIRDPRNAGRWEDGRWKIYRNEIYLATLCWVVGPHGCPLPHSAVPGSTGVIFILTGL